MNPFLLLREALRAIARQKLRSTLSTLGIVISVAAVVAMQAVGSGASARMNENLAGLGTNRLVIYPSATRGAAGGARVAPPASLTEDDAFAIKAEVRGVAAVAPILRTSAQVVAGSEDWPSSAEGVTRDYLTVQGLQLKDGAFWDEFAETHNAKVCVLGQTVAQQLFTGRNPLGTIIRVNRMPCEVVGVLAPKGQSARGNDQDDMVLMPLGVARSRVVGVFGVRSVSIIYVMAKQAKDTTRMERDIRNLLRERHRINWQNGDDFSVGNLAEIAQAAQSTASTLKILLLVIALISLVVGGIGIMNIMLVSVTERTREIGIRLALGATARDVLLQFLVEAVVLTGIGGAIGVGLGAGTARAVRSIMGWNTELAPDMVVVAVVFSGLVGVIFGLLPSIRAARLDPIEALRHE